MRKRKAALDAIPPVDRSVEDGILHVTRRFRGLPPERAVGYLENLGGTRASEDEVEGDGWRARLSAETVPVGPSYRLTEVTVTWSGDEEVVESIVLRFRVKPFRAPG